MDLSTSYTIKAQVTGQNQIQGLQKGLGGLTKQTNKTSAAMGKLKSAAGNAFGALKALAPAIGVAGLGKLVNDTLQLGDQLEKMSQKTGLAVPVLDKLRQAANLGGTEFKTLSRALPTLAKNMQDASDGVGTAKEAFDRLGLGVTNADGSLKSLDQMFFEIGDKIKAMDDRTLAAANAAEIFGTGMGAKLIPIMNQGSEAIKNLSTGFTQLSAERMATLNDDIAQMGEKFNVLKVQLTEAVLPVLSKLVDIISRGAIAFAKLPAPIKGLTLVLALLVPTILALAPVFASLIISFKIIAKIKLATAFAGIIPAVTSLIGAFAPLLPGAAIVLGITALIALFVKFRVQIGQFLLGLGEALLTPFRMFGNFVSETFKKVVGGISTAFNAIPNIVKRAISAATAPLRAFLNFLGNTSSIAVLRMGGGVENRFAKGGVVSSPELALVGEGGDTEYIIPSRKAAKFSQNYLAGLRGAAAIPRMAEGGVVTPKTANISITTGNVTQMNNQNFVTLNDLSIAVKSGVDQTLNILQNDIKTRRELGLT